MYILQSQMNNPLLMNKMPTHGYVRIYPEYADGWYLRSSKLDPNHNKTGTYLDYKYLQTCLEGKRGTEMAMYLPLKAVERTVLKDRPEYEKKHKCKKHLYRK
ncbi:uncharacterized protein LOC128958529 isoform X2 [Oppia nitens]|uniref:uncharacterized protein LOC128958529 isoform X2 n=1 Tax=Oppia nitens TaxID=1686743 RepID=UPI0023DBA390|nr:uncharacterized protein LOC128958529 isoform X2 [Oppia nitens]XP_054160379.1 uncharacterized protein LOC128958529 isoform X2 [Oppia nitens]